MGKQGGGGRGMVGREGGTADGMSPEVRPHVQAVNCGKASSSSPLVRLVHTGKGTECCVPA